MAHVFAAFAGHRFSMQHRFELKHGYSKARGESCFSKMPIALDAWSVEANPNRPIVGTESKASMSTLMIGTLQVFGMYDM
jgi:hypothetical protein